MEDKKKPTCFSGLRIYDHWLIVGNRLPLEFANSADARAAGLLPGEVFRTGEILKIVLEV